MTDQFTRLQSVLKDVTYKPGYALSATKLNFGVIQIFVTKTTQDVETLQPTKLTMAKAINEEILAAYSIREILEEIVIPLLRKFEEHELRKWFKYKKSHVLDPHPNDCNKKHKPIMAEV